MDKRSSWKATTNGRIALGLPIELWPLAGFRFQRFDMTAHDGMQLINDERFLVFQPLAPPFR